MMSEKLSSERPPRSRFLLAVGSVVLLVACFYLVVRKPAAPPALVVSDCKKSGPGMRSIGDLNGFQFDVTEKDFSISEGTQDAPPFAHGFVLRPRNSAAVFNIGEEFPIESIDTYPARVFSKDFEKRGIFDSAGHRIGEDYWGYLDTGERWRQIRLFKGSVVAKYGLVDKKEAEMFDGIASSVCFLSR
jgi:hypothetical protein